MILENHWITIREVVDDDGISFGLFKAIFTDVLVTKRAAAMIVPKLQNFEQNHRRMDNPQGMLSTFSHELKKNWKRS